MCSSTPSLPARVMDGDTIRGIITESKSGRSAILAKVVIDCTGDADVAYRAGVPCEKGNADGGMQPPTLMFCLGGRRYRQAAHEHRQPSRAPTSRISFRPSISARTISSSSSGLRELIAQGPEGARPQHSRTSARSSSPA